MSTPPTSPSKPPGGGRDLQALEARRMEAARLFRRRMSLAQIARELGVSRQAVHQWHRTWQQDGRKGLRAAPRLGRHTKLTDAQWRRVEQALDDGPEAHGFAGQVWTLPRVARLIEDLTGIRHAPSQVSVLLRRAGWSVQKPQLQAVERDETAIAGWRRTTWPQLTRGASSEATGSSSSTSPPST